MGCVMIGNNFHKHWKTFIKSFNFVLTDCDGVIWIGDTVLPGSSETLSLFRKLGKKIMFVTNNSTKSTEEYMRKFKKLGIEAHEEELFCTSYCAASYLSSLGFNKKVYLVGSSGTSQELEKAGIPFLPIGADPIQSSWPETLQKGIDIDKDVGAVVVAFDEHLSYLKIAKAITYLSNPECLYVATNTDEQFPSQNKQKIVVPGTGAIVASVTTGSQRTPVVLGKPDTFMFDCIKRSFPEITAEKCLMIGDRMNTDIAFGHNIGAQTLLTLSGVTSMEELCKIKESREKDENVLLPDFVANTLGDLKELLEKELDQ